VELNLHSSIRLNGAVPEHSGNFTFAAKQKEIIRIEEETRSPDKNRLCFIQKEN
jgi:hypothetical protein